MQMMAGGGILGFGEQILSGAEHLLRGAAAAAFIPFKNAAGALLGHVSIDWVKGMGQQFLNEMYNWIKGVNDKGIQAAGPSGSRLQHAKNVIDASRIFNGGEQGAIIGLITALVESNLQNYANSNIPESLGYPHDAVGNDHYSAGIMQQQTGPFGTYWGTVAQVMDPKYAATRFFVEMVNKVRDWRTADVAAVAQAVQVSAFPDRYISKLGEAVGLISQLAPDLIPKIPGGGRHIFAAGGIANYPTAGVFGEAGSEILAPLTPLWNRFDRLEARQQQLLSQSNGSATELHFHGDLSFPNVRNDKDADLFISHLKGLAG
jgi:hypothetical protein